MNKSRIISAIVSCRTIDQVESCFYWVADLKRKKVIDDKQEDQLLNLMNSQLSMLERKRFAQIQPKII